MGITETVNTDSTAAGALRVVIAGGGTGGHLFPGIAIAETFVKRQAKTEILFVTSGKKIEETVLANTPYAKKRISAEGIKGKSVFAKLRSVAKLPKGLIDSLKLLVAFKPDAVIGMGAYSAGPVVLGAWMLRIPRVICEQNSIPGLTNRMLAGLVQRIYVSFPGTGFKTPDKMYFTGNPVRAEILQTMKNGASAETGRKNQGFTILISGGSQGAHRLNMAMLEAMDCIKDPENYTLIHQTGATDADLVRSAYEQKMIRHEVAPFFKDMAARYRQADLVICRSGATTVAELTAAGRPALFIPFPFATDNHQVFNAKALVDGGAAEMIMESELTGKLLAERIEYYAGHPDALKIAGEKIRQFSQPDAADKIVDDIYRIINTGAQPLCAG
ncbi:MAG: undecaprenyldiphospho-muramoylpentapeptide beta-N-acetylglucosaminyltransferase [Desulfobacteraceae bacterium]|nr:MAG: undecaprenyldiphospho-muramoylpentapeptide beta-N-acetylglucosaminyltransferase [Desulfobacteraceae bacterium]